MLQRAQARKAQRWSHITPARPGFYTRARQVIADPSNQFVASADNFGRIMLLRQSNLQVLRMWKGYRDAQIGWVHAPDRWPHQVHRSACLLACLLACLPGWMQPLTSPCALCVSALSGWVLLHPTVMQRVLDLVCSLCCWRLIAMSSKCGA